MASSLTTEMGPAQPELQRDLSKQPSLKKDEPPLKAASKKFAAPWHGEVPEARRLVVGSGYRPAASMAMRLISAVWMPVSSRGSGSLVGSAANSTPLKPGISIVECARRRKEASPPRLEALIFWRRTEPQIGGRRQRFGQGDRHQHRRKGDSTHRLGMKNWRFAGSAAVGPRAARIQALLASAVRF